MTDRPVPGRAQGELWTGLKRIVQKLSRSGNAEKLERLKVRGENQETGRIDEIDFLRDLLVSKRSMILTNAVLRTVESSSAFTEIQAAYRDLQDEIRASVGSLEEDR